MEGSKLLQLHCNTISKIMMREIATCRESVVRPLALKRITDCGSSFLALCELDQPEGLWRNTGPQGVKKIESPVISQLLWGGINCHGNTFRVGRSAQTMTTEAASGTPHTSEKTSHGSPHHGRLAEPAVYKYRHPNKVQIWILSTHFTFFLKKIQT